MYSGTVFEGRRLRPEQVVLLVKGVVKGEQAQILANEIGVCRQTVQAIGQQIHANAQHLQADNPLDRDEQTETDEMYQNAGGKSDPHLDPADRPRRRANKQRGHGTYENDRPPIVGTVGRESGKVRLRMVEHTDRATLCEHVEQFTTPGTQVYTDEWRGYNHVDRPHNSVCHAQKEWARDDAGDGIREVHINRVEGLWTLVRNFMRLFRGVHKKFLAADLAICEFHLNLKRITPDFIAALVAAPL